MDKTRARETALSARSDAHAARGDGRAAHATAALIRVLRDLPVGVLAGYRPMRDEIDPTPAMRAAEALGWRLCLPVVEGRGMALRFDRWRIGAPLVAGAYGAEIPAQSASVTPDVLIVPMLAYHPSMHRLGYGGGFYDRTLASLRGADAPLAIGLAYAAQRMDALPVETTDQPLDMIVTERGVLTA